MGYFNVKYREISHDEFLDMMSSDKLGSLLSGRQQGNFSGNPYELYLLLQQLKGGSMNFDDFIT